MYAFKQIFLVLSLISLASAKKGVSSKTKPEVEARRGLKKSSSKKSASGVSGGVFIDPNRGGGVSGGSPNVGGVNRDGTTPGELIEPVGKDCIPFEEASVWLTGEYPGDEECRTAGFPFPVTSACCRVFSFTDTTGSAKWLLYDANNQYKDLICVCGVNTRSGAGDSGSTPIITTPGIPTVAQPIAVPVSAPVVPPTPPGLSVCANPNDTQKELQNRAGMTGCATSDECPGERCCSSDTCVCMPKTFLGNAYCA